MTNLAIRGHKERGKEVIEILKMLGGKDVGYSGIGSQYYNYIDEFDNITGTTGLPESKTFITYTIEEFLEKYPYKTGDKVKYINNIFCIKSSQWDSYKKTVIYYIDADWSAGYAVKANELQPYKEETMEEQIKINIPKGYEFAGVDVDNQQVVFTRIQPKYPKTYEECCKVLGVNPSFDIKMIEDEESSLYFNFIDLVRCRDAYWKIAGKQMGLDKPWEPDLENEELYCIQNYNNQIVKNKTNTAFNKILIFPTEEMRDAFYENFKDLIEECKELL